MKIRTMENKEYPGTNGDNKKGVLEKATDYIERITSGTRVSGHQKNKEVSHFDPEDEVDDLDEPEPEYDEDDPMADV